MYSKIIEDDNEFYYSANDVMKKTGINASELQFLYRKKRASSRPLIQCVKFGSALFFPERDVLWIVKYLKMKNDYYQFTKIQRDCVKLRMAKSR